MPFAFQLSGGPPTLRKPRRVGQPHSLGRAKGWACPPSLTIRGIDLIGDLQFRQRAVGVPGQHVGVGLRPGAHVELVLRHAAGAAVVSVGVVVERAKGGRRQLTRYIIRGRSNRILSRGGVYFGDAALGVETGTIACAVGDRRQSGQRSSTAVQHVQTAIRPIGGVDVIPAARVRRLFPNVRNLAAG